MTINSRIRNAVTPYVSACEYGAYTGLETTYCTFLFPKTSAEVIGDDTAIIDIVPIELHLFVPSTTNFLTLKKQIRASLKDAGFTYPNVTCLYETDTKLNHLIFECEIKDASETEA